MGSGSKLRLGIVGLGWAGRQHARAARALSDQVTLETIADPSSESRAFARDTLGVSRIHEDWQELIGAGGIDAVSICTPHSDHSGPVIAALEAGTPVLVEKPLASSLVEADRMIEASRRAGVPLMVAESVRFRSVFTEARRLVRTGEIGRVFLVRVDRIHNMHDYLLSRPWFLSDPAAGIMASGGVHDFEIVRMIAGDITSVYAVQAPRALEEMKADDTSVAVATLDSGVVATLTESFSTHGPSPSVSGVAYGTTGTVWFDQDGGLSIMKAGEQKPGALGPFLNDPFVDELGHFLDCAKSGAEPATSATDQRKPLAAVAAAYASMRLGRGVRVDELAGGGWLRL